MNKNRVTTALIFLSGASLTFLVLTFPWEMLGIETSSLPTSKIVALIIGYAAVAIFFAPGFSAEYERWPVFGVFFGVLVFLAWVYLQACLVMVPQFYSTPGEILNTIKTGDSLLIAAAKFFLGWFVFLWVLFVGSLLAACTIIFTRVGLFMFVCSAVCGAASQVLSGKRSSS